MKLCIRSEATDELEEAIQWYAERSEEADRNFKAAIDAALTGSSSRRTYSPQTL